MGVLSFEALASKVTKSFDLKFLEGSVIGFDAAYFLGTIPKDFLLSALGGSPLGLESTISDTITGLQAAGLTLHFVFDGLDCGAKNDPFASSTHRAQLNHNAFTLYETNHAEQAIQIFKTADNTNADFTAFSEILKKTLHEHRVPFTVAPYSALAQLVSYERHPSQFVDAIFGPPELFCFGVDRLITKFETHPAAPKHPSFLWIDKQDCLAELGNVPNHIFIDALMLAGSSLLDTFPPLLSLATYRKGNTIRSAVDIILSCNGSVSRVCAQYASEPAVKGVYLDQYKMATTRIRHQAVLTAEGDVETSDKEHAPDDAHVCIGLRLPDELYMYLSRAMLRPRVPNWLASGNIYVIEPLTGGDGRSYQDLVRTQLEPLRRQALSLLSEPMHRYYHGRDITTKLWFDPNYEGKFNMKEVTSPRGSLSKWNVKNDLIAGVTTEHLPPGTLSFAVLSLAHPEFAARTVTPKPKAGSEPLKYRNEIFANAVWRLLQLRGYVNEQHQLTAWGKILEAALSASGTRKDQEEAVFLAVELMRFGLVSPDTMFVGYDGAPKNGSDIDRRNCMLVSRVACFGKIRHQSKGYSGPLSRHLLAYQSIVSNVHASLRDLVEMNLAAMFLEGLVDRDRDDWVDISLGLPFYQEHSCALGVLTINYLDDLCAYPDPNSADVRNEVRTKGQNWIQKSDFNGSLDDALQLWDAVYAGVKAAGAEVKDTKMWGEVNAWLSERR